MKVRKNTGSGALWHCLLTRVLCLSGILLLLMGAGCTESGKSLLNRNHDSIVLLNPEMELGEDWQHRRLRGGNTTYTHVKSVLGHSIRAQGNESASILFRFFDPISLDCDTLGWSWYVEHPQAGADLRVKGRDDVAAAVFIMFSDPGIFQDRPVPTLKYVWTNNHHQVGDIIVGPYFKKYMRTFVVRTGSATDQKMVMNRTNLSEDYKKAFAENPPDGIYGVAIFTDNDDTREPIVAHYGKIELFCDE